MNREELIQKLSQVSFCAIPTVITEDMGLEYDYITPKGAGSSFGNIGDWPAYKLRKIPDDQWKMIKEKIEQKTLTEADLSGTELGRLVDDLHSIYGELYARFYPDLPDLFAGIKKLPDELPDFYYCRIDCGSWGDTPDFYIDVAIKQTYQGQDEPVEDEGAVYLSGNGPLVAVLTEALAQDNLKRCRERNEKKKGSITFSVCLMATGYVRHP